MIKASQGRNKVWQKSAPMVIHVSVRSPRFHAAIFPKNTPSRAERMMDVVKSKIVLGSRFIRMSTHRLAVVEGHAHVSGGRVLQVVQVLGPDGLVQPHALYEQLGILRRH
jgi:hypothetical protein